MPDAFQITASPLDATAIAALAAALDDPRAGAVATFEGRVRNHNDDLPVSALDYEAFAPLAESEGALILAEAREKFPLLAAAAVHRTGRLAIGDLAVWVGAAAAHRDAAFAACRYIIDEAKARLPIWKQEHYTDGTPSHWINCSTRGTFANDKSPPR